MSEALLGFILLLHTINADLVKVPVILTFDTMVKLVFLQSSGMLSQPETPSQIGDVKEWFDVVASPSRKNTLISSGLPMWHMQVTFCSVTEPVPRATRLAPYLSNVAGLNRPASIIP